MDQHRQWLEVGFTSGIPRRSHPTRPHSPESPTLPLAGSPSLAVLGSEVYLGTGYADILAAESSGRPTIIEVKLSSNREARRAIVSQAIGYAAFLRGYNVSTLEHGPLRKHLAAAGYGTILEAVQSQDQEGAADATSFEASFQDFLDQGSFRLVLVLDEVSAELERVVGYLDAITVQALTIDLITIKVYEVNGAEVALPQRISPDTSTTISCPTSDRSMPESSSGVLSDGADAFRESIDDTEGKSRALFDQLIMWAEELGSLPNVRLFSYAGKHQYSLMPRIIPDNTGLITIWNYKGQPSISVWRSVFDRLAPKSIESVEQAIGPTKLGQGNTVYGITPQVLETVTAAYRETSTKA